MGKAKGRQHAALPKSKDGSLGDMDLDGEDGWVIVKKQRVTILIPSSLRAENSAMTKPGPSNLETMPTEAVNNETIMPVETSNKMPSLDEQEKVASVAPNRVVKMPTKISAQKVSASNKLPRVHRTPSVDEQEKVTSARGFKIPTQKISASQKLPRVNGMPIVDKRGKVTSKAPNRGVEIPTKIITQQISASHELPRVNVEMETEKPDRSHTLKFYDNMHGVSNVSKVIKRPRQLNGQLHFFDGSILLNRRLRASLLEKKLRKAGGLSSWLASIGLGQFVNFFEGNVGKFQLVNLTMKKLKDMGADAVGPRRKLMHAIDCICQPYCFEAR